ncbi:hypothetical protein GIX45_10455 [Erwinia sp. CPCC 100877]|nr:hypothetical protein [Erwinia sp. CPCC 100877]
MKHNISTYGIAAVIIIFFLVGCTANKSQAITRSNLESIKMGTSQKKVEAKLGKAKVVVKDEDEISQMLKADLKTVSKLSANDPEQLAVFIGDDDLTELQKQITNLVNGEKIEVLQYELKEGGTENLYLIDGVVVLKSFD